MKILVTRLFNKFIKLPTTEEEWMEECKAFIENYEFPCVDAWDGFHVHVKTHLKNHFSFKNKYTVSCMGLIGHNKRFLHLTTGAPGSMHDARLLRQSLLFHSITSGGGIPNKSVNLRDAGEIPLTTIGDSTFKVLTKTPRTQKKDSSTKSRAVPEL